MRVGLVAFIVIAVMTPTFFGVLHGRVSADDFGLRFAVAVVFAMICSGLIGLFGSAMRPKDTQPTNGPLRRRTDHDET